MDQFLQDATQKINDAILHLQKELSTIRAGRANPSLLEEIPVIAYGTRMKLMELGTILAPQPSLLTVQVWDASAVKDVEKGIREANLGLNPAVEGQLIRVPIPPLTAERREEFIKVAHQLGEQSKIAIRQIRAEAKEGIELEEEEGEIGEDDMHRNLESLQELVNKSNDRVDELIKTKEEELKEI